MSLKILSNKNVGIFQKLNLLLTFNRNGHWIRGKPPGIASTLTERLKREYPTDEIELKLKNINIGFPHLKKSRSITLKERLEYLKSNRNNNKLNIDLDLIIDDSVNTTWPFQLKRISEHYGIFGDLFNRAYFIPRIPLNINYEYNNNLYPVYNGNIILPELTKSKPNVNFIGDLNMLTLEKTNEINLWSILLLNLDGNYTSKFSEHIHWFISNIPNNDITKGETIVPYLQPFPSKGIGCQRFVFILYKQDTIFDFTKYKIEDNIKKNIENYSFNTLEFYRTYQNSITPASLSFFQSKWDKSVIEFNYKQINNDGKQPIFEYDFPKPFVAEQKWFPLKQPFNIYMDKHNEPKTKEYQIKDYLKTVHPFKVSEKIRFPNAVRLDKNVPSWLKVKIKKDRLGIGRICDI